MQQEVSHMQLFPAQCIQCLYNIFVCPAIHGRLGCSFYFVSTDRAIAKIVMHVSQSIQNSWVVDASLNFIDDVKLISKMGDPGLVRAPVPNFSDCHTSHYLRHCQAFHFSFIELGEKL